MSQNRKFDLRSPSAGYFGVGIAFVVAGIAFVAAGQPLWVAFVVLGVVFVSIGVQERAKETRKGPPGDDDDASSPEPSA